MTVNAPAEELKISGAGSNGADILVPAPDAANGIPKEAQDSDDDADEDFPAVAAEDGASKKKKKRKGKPKKKTKKVQTDPPAIPISQLFPNNTYPKGEEVEYQDGNRYRRTDEEKRHLDKLNSDFLSDYRQAAEAHRQVRQWAQRNIKPGQTLLEIANGIEDSVRRLVGHDGLTEGDSLIAGMGFPTGLNIDNIVAHYSPNATCKTVLGQNNVLKVDIGIHVGGRIVDSAFTMAFDPMYDNLLAAVKDATNTGVREAGIDVRVGELGGYIQEAMESYECEISGTVHPIKAIRDLCGHTILPYSIHGSKNVPLIKTNDMTKMEEGDVFAIETFGSTGSGRYIEAGEVSHYALRRDAHPANLTLSSARSVLGAIKKNFSTIPFCRRYLDRIGQEKYLFGLNHLVKAGIVEDYPPLVEKQGTYTAQFEHSSYEIRTRIFSYFQDPRVIGPGHLSFGRQKDRRYDSLGGREAAIERSSAIAHARLACRRLNQAATEFLCPEPTVTFDHASLDELERMLRNPLVRRSVHGLRLNLTYRPKGLAEDEEMFARSRIQNLLRLASHEEDEVRMYKAVYNAWRDSKDDTDHESARYQQILRDGHAQYQQKHKV
ncbi:hypothetical protein DL765_005536 [Monosporascus sp. GIB2]|nr:hypothetical protein DL765_005536 [Monosporascus sp. GIB2]